MLSGLGSCNPILRVALEISTRVVGAGEFDDRLIFIGFYSSYLLKYEGKRRERKTKTSSVLLQMARDGEVDGSCAPFPKTILGFSFERGKLNSTCS